MPRTIVCRSQAHWNAAQSLVEDYWSELGLPPAFQGFEHELEVMDRYYGGENGRFVITVAGGLAVGCGGFRRLDAERCELKRMFVKAAYRGRGLAVAILDHLAIEARAAGYRSMMADTLPSMTRAQALYEGLGFVRVPPYSGAPTPNAIYLSLDLERQGPT